MFYLYMFVFMLVIKKNFTFYLNGDKLKKLKLYGTSVWYE